MPGLGRPPGGGHRTHSSVLAWRIPVDRGIWQATVHGVAESQTRLSNYTLHSTGGPRTPVTHGRHRGHPYKRFLHIPFFPFRGAEPGNTLPTLGKQCSFGAQVILMTGKWISLNGNSQTFFCLCLVYMPRQFHQEHLSSKQGLTSEMLGSRESSESWKSCHITPLFHAQMSILRLLCRCLTAQVRRLKQTPQHVKRMLTLVFNTFQHILSELPTTILTPFPLGNQWLQEKNTPQLVITFDETPHSEV